jgi:glyoxylate/hydroxypyruvate reductase A
MKIGIIAPKERVKCWLNTFKNYDENIDISTYPDIDYNNIDCVCLWNHPKKVLGKFKNLKLIHSMGAGVDHIINDPSCPKGIPICRISDDKLSFSMTNYIITAVLFYHRRILKYQNDKKNKLWDHITHPEILPINIGILGFGVLGSDAADKLKYMGFNVIGYSLNKKKENGIKIYHGEELDLFLSKINVLVCTVPYTQKTHHLLDRNLFKKLNKETYLVNVSRGKVQNEKDIIEYIDNGTLSGAFLDVFETEPLPKSSEIWKHDKIQITPHNASITNEDAAVPQILDNYNRLASGKSLINQVNIENEY